MHWIALLPTTPPDPADAAADAAAAQQALGWQALRFTPRVVLQDEAVLLEVAASARLFGGLRALVVLLTGLVDEEKMPLASANWAYGATSLVALARLRVRMQQPQAGPVQAQALPLATLSAASAHTGVLERIGCRTWGDLRRLPRAGVARRFGPPLLAALDQALGDQPESHTWLALPAVFDERLELGALVQDAHALLFAARRLLARLRGWLVAQGAGLLALQLVWHCDARRGGPAQGELRLRLSEPAQDMAHATRLLAEHLAHIPLPAPVHTLGLRSLEVAPLPGASHSLLPEERRQGDASLAQLVERLGARLGPQAVRRWQPCASQVPERMQRWVAAQGLPARARSAGTGEEPGLCEALLPSWLLAAPLALEVRGNRPWYQGPLTLLAGPQRLESSGWLASAPAAQQPAVMRDYFIARSGSAGLLWIFRPRLGTQAGWYLHGIFA